ncbi:hypothetical protein J2Z60_000473 [Lactobacillus colini]|uniref:Uncharacterized protein n=1 Tax=Lactobacillus colini TaxID=1819254 RepID=A0ABS4MC94_9LACO|nr:hypothetical protein [Lactobacillus colini]MBP2057309.1 hypothetical protein [Lactobacillus colini]
MSENSVEGSTFAEVSQSKRTPVGSALDAMLPKAIGTIFKLVSGTTEQVEETKDGVTSSVDRAVYTVQVLNSELLPLGTELVIKVKGQKCILSENQNLQLLLSQTLYIVKFEDISRWSFNSMEGLNATKIGFVKLSPEQLAQVINRGK